MKTDMLSVVLAHRRPESTAWRGKEARRWILSAADDWLPEAVNANMSSIIEIVLYAMYL